MILFSFLCFCSFLSDAQQEKHFLHYKFTVLTRTHTFPEFSGVCVYDDRRIKHFSNEERVWIKESAHDWTNTLEEPADSKDFIIRQIRTLSDCTHSLCPGHVLQRIIGCELEKLPDGSVNLTVFDDYGFDGEDLISFDYDTAQWIDKTPKAKETKMKWDFQTERNQFIKNYLKTCTDWISTLHNTKQIPPHVHAFVPKLSDDGGELLLTCLATGFYPRDVEMNIRLNRINLEDQTSSGIRANHDETFQKRISVKIDRNHEGSYDCLVTHSGLTQSRPVVTVWNRRYIGSETGCQCLLVVGAALALIVIGCCIQKKMVRYTASESVLHTRKPQDHISCPKSVRKRCI